VPSGSTLLFPSPRPGRRGLRKRDGRSNRRHRLGATERSASGGLAGVHPQQTITKVEGAIGFVGEELGAIFEEAATLIKTPVMHRRTHSHLLRFPHGASIILDPWMTR